MRRVWKEKEIEKLIDTYNPKELHFSFEDAVVIEGRMYEKALHFQGSDILFTENESDKVRVCKVNGDEEIVDLPKEA